MKTINVTDEMYAFLIDLSRELNTQNSRATVNPRFYQILTKEQVAAPEGCGTEAWNYDGSLIETDEEINEAIAEYKGISLAKVKKLNDFQKEEILEDAGYRKVWYDYKDIYENAFLTEKACNEHIESKKHHYNNPVSYLTYASYNPELETLIKFLTQIFIDHQKESNKEQAEKIIFAFSLSVTHAKLSKEYILHRINGLLDNLKPFIDTDLSALNMKRVDYLSDLLSDQSLETNEWIENIHWMLKK